MSEFHKTGINFGNVHPIQSGWFGERLQNRTGPVSRSILYMPGESLGNTEQTTFQHDVKNRNAHHLLVNVRASAKELRITDRIRKVGVQQILTKSCRRFVRHLDTVLQHGHWKLDINNNSPSLSTTRSFAIGEYNRATHQTLCSCHQKVILENHRQQNSKTSSDFLPDLRKF